MIAVALSLLLTQTPADTGTIRGRVTDQESGQPIEYAAVQLARRDRLDHSNVAAVTDERGVFEFAGLSPGVYSALVTAAGHVPNGLKAAAGGMELTVTRGQTLQTLAALARAFTITVRVVDEFGDPLSDIPIDVISSETGNAAAMMHQRLTDDLGRLRIPGLGPGRYFVCADAMGERGSSGDVRPAARERLFRTCYPDATDSDAESVLVSRDIDGLEIRMRRGRTFTVTGSIVDAEGRPGADAQVMIASYKVNGSSANTVHLDADGRFRLANVHPGDYALEVTRGGRNMPQVPAPLEAAFAPIHVDADLDGVVVAMRTVRDVPGRIVVDDPSAALPPRRRAAPILIVARLADEHLPGHGSSIDAAALDSTFTLRDVFGSRAIEVLNVPKGWFVKALRYGSKNVFDQPVDFGEDSQTLEVVLATRGASVGGTVTNDANEPAARAQVLLFRAGAPGEAPTRAVASPDGAFTIGPLREGDYVIVAIPADAPAPRRGDWSAIARLVAKGERLTLGEFDQRTIHLRVVAAR